MQIIESQHAIEWIQRRFPRSKKRRIKKKWRKNLRNFIAEPTGFRSGNLFILHPVLALAYRQQLAKNVGTLMDTKIANMFGGL